MQDRSVFGPSIVIDGSVESNEGVVVHGTIKGDVKVDQDVVIYEDGVVEGDVEAQVVQVSGRVTGDVVAHARVEILVEGKMQGDLKTPRIAIADGAHYQGHIEMME